MARRQRRTLLRQRTLRTEKSKTARPHPTLFHASASFRIVVLLLTLKRRQRPSCRKVQRSAYACSCPKRSGVQCFLLAFVATVCLHNNVTPALSVFRYQVNGNFENHYVVNRFK